MEFHRHDAHHDVLVLVADNQLDSYSCGTLVAELQREIDAGARALIVDCSRVGYVSTIAICTLLRLHKRLAEQTGGLRLAGVQPPLRRVLAITRLDHVFHLFPSVEDALQASVQPHLPGTN